MQNKVWTSMWGVGDGTVKLKEYQLFEKKYNLSGFGKKCRNISIC